MAIFDLTYYNGEDFYSDGDIENEIVEYLKEYRDDGEYVFETDTRWPVFYHLSSVRKNILSWYDFKPNSNVLEIGAGFGAVTGVLCDKCTSVTSVELSKRRATGLYERHINRNNLKIMVGNFNDMKFDQKFDYITLIGVLEYAASFTDGENPYEGFLSKIKKLLKPDGKLLIAIENRFGLKYWCGAEEDHTGIPFDGINGYKNTDFVKTFSKTELINLLNASGYKNTDFYYPYPDYKLPQTIYSDRYLPNKLNASKTRDFYLNTQFFTAEERKIIGDIAENDVFPFFSNSFLVEACCAQPDKNEVKLNAAFYTYDRKKEYRIVTCIFNNGTVLKAPTSNYSIEHIKAAHKNYVDLLNSKINVLPEKLTDRGIVSEYITLPDFQQVIKAASEKDDKSEYFALIDLFFENILKSSEIISGSGIDAVLKNGYLDMAFSNCFVKDKELMFFDQEWRAENITAGYILFRALNHFFTNLKNDILMNETYSRLGLDDEHLEQYRKLENEFIASVFDFTVVDYLSKHTFNFEMEINHLIMCKDNTIKQLNDIADYHNKEITALKEVRDTLYKEKHNLEIQLQDLFKIRELLETDKTNLTAQLEKCQNSYNEAVKLYYDTLAYANGLVAAPHTLGRRKIAKAFIKLFIPSFVLRAGRKFLNLLRKIKNLRNIKISALGYDAWVEKSIPRTEDIEKLEKEPLISILVPLYNTDKKMLCEMIESCLNQTYTNFELCLADASDNKHAYVYKTAKSYADKDNRVKVEKLKENLGISGNTNKCREMATGDYIALLDHDDLLIKHALYSMAKAINTHNPDVIYSDEDHIKDGKRKTPFFKPDFNRDLLYSQMYICHLLCFKAELFDKVGGLDDKFSGSQDYDLMLRLTEHTDNIYHIPDILYSWRETETSTSVNPDSKPYAHDAGKGALDAHLKRRYGDIAHAEDSDYLFVFDARFDTLKNNPLVSIIIPTKDHTDLLEDCVHSILEKSTYKNYEVLILDNNSEKPESFDAFERLQKLDSRVRVIDAFFEFNWSKLNNFGIKNSNGEVYIFLNNDTVVISPDWIERLAENALRDDIGVVGGLLLFEDETIQHAGVVVGMNGWADHIYAGMPQTHAADKFVSPMINRDVLAVTGACMAISKKTIEKIGMFDESFIVCGSDVEICIRAYDNGLNVLYNSRVKLYHYESKSRDTSKIPQIDFVRSEQTYRRFIESGDPFFSKNLDINSKIPRIDV